MRRHSGRASKLPIESTRCQGIDKDPRRVVVLKAFSPLALNTSNGPPPTSACHRHRAASVALLGTVPHVQTPRPLPREEEKEHWLCNPASSSSPSGPG